ncbi:MULTISPECIES: hypothetical protein [Brucella]|nr:MULTISPECIES: hypothetical protein [Brucella]EPZ75188.1 hypothetical protein M798_13245 [Brucella melitensis ADMAS-G1]AIJ84782.1 putative membrane protein [Brucella melitensis bv. 3 str. Ether]AIJ89041.1 putative membrane protein [Brucella melitensis bv. 1 str. 16M]AOG50045.1 hypothetical protein BFL33_06520 [Brucella melitensis]ARY24882.1 hypothetical protein BK187_07105 [Brucella melitensis]
MDTLLHLIAILIGIFGLLVYFRSVIRVMLLNWRERDLISYFAAVAAVVLIRRFTDSGAGYERIQRSQAWVFPVFVILSVAFWFLLVQLCFTLILWGTRAETSFIYSFTASGSALSTLGFKTPSSWLGEFLAIVEGAMGLAIVVLLFSFVPGYLAAVQARERKVGWLYDRTEGHPTYQTVLEGMNTSEQDINDTGIWEDWEDWFRGIYETHTTAPILTFVPSIYHGANWLRTSASILDTASLLMSVLDEKKTYAAHMCRDIGARTIQLLAKELHITAPSLGRAIPHSPDLPANTFDLVYNQLVANGVPVNPDKEKCRETFTQLRAEYAADLNQISRITSMPL